MKRPFEHLVKAYNQFLDTRLGANQGICNDLVSVVLFSGKEEVKAKADHIRRITRSFTCAGGNTNFEPAMKRALAILDEDFDDPIRKALTPVVVFMSDGMPDNEMGSGVTHCAAMNERHLARGLSFHAVSFGRNAGSAMLKSHDYRALIWLEL
jgi:uncharacterized protein YegL